MIDLFIMLHLEGYYTPMPSQKYLRRLKSPHYFQGILNVNKEY